MRGRIDWLSAAIGAAALVAILRLRWGVVRVIAACAGIGLAARLAGLA
jgi:hypothetical protein